MKKSFGLFCAAAVAALALSLPAGAQTNDTTATLATQQRQDATSTSAVGGVTGSNNFTIEASVIPVATRADIYQHVETSGTTTVKNTPSLGGASLTTSNDTCMGSSSVGGAGPGFALQVGTTWVDENCKRLKASRELWNKGYRAASLAVDCMDVAMKEALEMTGTKCPQSMTEEERKATYAARPVAVAPTPMVAPAAPVASAVVPTQVADASVRTADRGEFIDLRSPR